jgi:serine/threonine protein kinase
MDAESVCPPEAELEGLASGELPSSAAQELCRHLEACRQCRAVVDRLCDDSLVGAWYAQAEESSPEPDGPDMQQLLPRWQACVSQAVESQKDSAGASNPFSFLGPPRVPGDMGTLGNYRVLDQIGQGGMGIVLRGRHDTLANPLAIKVLRPELVNERTRKRLLHGARLAARCRNEHVARVYAVVSLPPAPPYIVMEHVAGPSLAEAIARKWLTPPAEAVAIALQIAEGLGAAHDADLIHGDVKPSNVVLDLYAGCAKLVDFGLARDLSDPKDMMLDGAPVGTLVYMSPEQLAGTVVDGRTDVYSLGVTLYEMLTTAVPFGGTADEVRTHILRTPPRRVSELARDIPPALDEICLRALAKDPQLRYASVHQMAHDLRQSISRSADLPLPVTAGLFQFNPFLI